MDIQIFGQQELVRHIEMKKPVATKWCALKFLSNIPIDIKNKEAKIPVIELIKNITFADLNGFNK